MYCKSNILNMFDIGLSDVCVWEKSDSSSHRLLADNYKCASILGTNDVMWHLKGPLFVSRSPFWAREKHMMKHNHWSSTLLITTEL